VKKVARGKKLNEARCVRDGGCHGDSVASASARRDSRSPAEYGKQKIAPEECGGGSTTACEHVAGRRDNCSQEAALL
jgi:hypothetical protein